MIGLTALNEQKVVVAPHNSLSLVFEVFVALQQHLKRQMIEHLIWLSQIGVVLERSELTNTN